MNRPIKKADSHEILINKAGHSRYDKPDSVENLIRYISRKNGKSQNDLLCCGAFGATDFTDINSVQTMIDKIKEFEIIPNNIVHLSALKAYNSQFHKDKWDNYELGWQISVRSVVLLLQAFISAMAKKHYGRVVFMLTSYTKNIPEKYQSSYVTIKYALLGLMKSLSAEYIDKGITINGVSPDMIETKFLSNIPELIIEKNKVNSPLGRNIYIEEVIPVIQHMLSDLGASMTGQNIVISGGIR